MTRRNGDRIQGLFIRVDAEERTIPVQYINGPLRKRKITEPAINVVLVGTVDEINLILEAFRTR